MFARQRDVHWTITGTYPLTGDARRPGGPRRPRSDPDQDEIDNRCRRVEGSRMPANPLTKVLYTAEATVQGGRAGHGRTADGRLDLRLSVPDDMGGPGGPGTNPEQLFAVGHGACFQSSLLAVAQGRKLDAGDTTITARVGIGPTGHGGFGLQVALDLHAPHLSPAEAADLMARADRRCPYSNATRGNIQVALSVDGAPLPRAAA
jgi:lipoyl-dependent peroxiredoxin